MFAATFQLELRLRAVMTTIAAVALVVLAAGLGVLYPAFGDSLSDLDLPESVGDLVGGGDYSTLVGFLKIQLVSTVGPIVLAGVGIACAAATIAGEEEDRILPTVLAHPVDRSRLLLAKGAAIAVITLVLTVALALGFLLANVLGDGDLTFANTIAQSVHLGGLGLFFAALALALGAGTGLKAIAIGGAAGIAGVMFLINGFAPSVEAIEFLKYTSAFYYANGSDPLTTGLDAAHLVALLAGTAALVTVAALTFRGRDLRG